MNLKKPAHSYCITNQLVTKKILELTDTKMLQTLSIKVGLVITSS